jgi:DNA primase
MNIDPSTTKYLISARLEAEGIVEKPDIVGAVFGQTEGLLGEELDLRDLQKSGRIGRIEVDVVSKKGRTEGLILIPSSLDQVETSIMAAALETIDRVGPCKATIRVDKVEDVRVTKRNKIVERARQLLTSMLEGSKTSGSDLLDEVRASVQVSEIVSYGPERLPAGPNVADSDAIIVVEGRQDVLNLLRSGIKNAIAVEGTNVPKTVQELSKEKVVTAFVDGDRGGDLILRELLQVAEVDFIARAPRGREVEELTQKQLTKSLRNKIPAEQFVEMYGLTGQVYKPEDDTLGPGEKDETPPRPQPTPRPPMPAPMRQEHRNEPRPEPRMEPRVEPRPEPAGDPEFEPPMREPAPAAPRASNPKLEKYRDMLTQISGSSKARILNDNDSIAAEVPVRALVETLRTNRQARAVVFDGIITQRILDIASEIGMRSVVGMKMGTITKQPSGIEVYTKTDLPAP